MDSQRLNTLVIETALDILRDDQLQQETGWNVNYEGAIERAVRNIKKQATAFSIQVNVSDINHDKIWADIHKTLNS